MTSAYAVRIEQVADINPTFKSGMLSSDELVDFLPMSAVDEGQSIAHANEYRALIDVQKGYTNFSDGDVLLAKITPCFENGKIAQVRLKHRCGFGSTEFHVIRPHANKLDGRYLVHFLRRDEVRLDGARKMTGSAGQRRVPKHYLASLSIYLPVLSEQRRIAAILDQADALRTKRRKTLAQLSCLAESIFIEMFGDPLANQKQWTTKYLGELLESITNGANADQTDSDSGWPITRIETIWNGAIDSARVKYVAPSEVLKERYQLQVGDILFSHINSPEHIAKTAIYQGTPSLMIHGINLLRLRCSSNEVNAHWLLHLLKQPSVRTYFRTRCKKAVNQASLNQQDIKSLICIVPPLELQAIFSERVEAARIHRLLHEKSAIELDKLFQSLQHRAFRGEL